jgi:uncharacterized membrane protein YqjE
MAEPTSAPAAAAVAEQAELSAAAVQEAISAEQLGLIEAARRLIEEGGDAARSGVATAAALKTLAQAEFALARAALTRAALLLALALVAGLVGLAYALATLTALLASAGLGWSAALAVSTALALLTAGLLAWRGLAASQHARFERTRRQLTRLRRERFDGQAGLQGADDES